MHSSVHTALQEVVVQLLSRVRLCDPMDCSTSGSPVLGTSRRAALNCFLRFVSRTPFSFFLFLVPAYRLLFIEVEFIKHNINLLKSYLFLAALGLHCCTWTFSSCGRAGTTLLIVVASLVTDHDLQGEWAQYLWLMGLAAPWHMGSSQTRHQTGVP